VSLIRKPAEAERESSVRRAAETAIAGGRVVRDAGREIGTKTRRTTSKVAQYYLLGMFTFGAVMASSVGAKLLGLAIMAPFWYLVLRKRKQPAAQPAAQTFAAATGAPNSVAPGATQSFYYRPGKNAGGAVLLGIFALVTGNWGLSPGHHAFLAFAAVMCVGAVVCAMHALSSGPALAFDRTTLRMRTTFGGVHEVPWQSVHRIDINVVTLRYMGLIPVSRNEILTVTCDGGVLGTRKLRIAPKALQLPAGGSEYLLCLLRQAQLDAVGTAGVPMAGAGPTGWGASSTSGGTAEANFDPDAAIARYLASKDAERPQPIALAPTPQPHLQRPTFGRRKA
jgi:hypothetical protein